jgi:hypothetical protein
MRKLRIPSALLAMVLFAATLFSQTNGNISGTISDASRAVLPGVTVTATNTATGIVTTVLSNDAGVYNFASLLPGTYKLTVELPGFRTETFNDVQLGNNAQLRLNATLEVAAAAQSVEVSVEAANLITTSSSSVGEVLPQKQIQDLPVVSNNVLDLVGVMGGTFMTNDKVFGAEQTQLAGVSARDINIQRDGISVNNERWPNGLDTPTKMNPDLVGEVRMILAPVDAEMGRGNGQIQIQTRSGTNQFRGSAVWNVQNSALDSNQWFNNAQSPRVSAPWRNVHDYDVAFGGPIKKNKTFFYALWNQLLLEQRQEITTDTLLTPCARLGIFRYYNGFVNGNASQPTVPTASGQQAAVVNPDGSPHSPDGSPLQYLSVFGQLASNPTKNDCSDAAINTTTLVPNGAASSWDPHRTHMDTTGFMAATLATMPIPNAYNILGQGDGLNTAVLRWVRRNHGADNLFGAGGDIENARKQINVKIDHNFNQRHRINGSYSYESDISDDAALPGWPNGYFGADFRYPQVLSVNFVSTLKSTLLNEARFGMSRTGANTVGAPERADIGATVRKGLLQVNGQPVFTNFANGVAGVNLLSSSYGVADGILYGSHEVSPRWIYGDSLSWTKGKHAFKFGGEYRWSGTKSSNQGSVQTGANLPTITLGSALLAPIQNIGRQGLAGNPFAANQRTAEQLLNFLSGSVSGATQGRFINKLNGAWNNYPNDILKIRDLAQNEFGFFFKDDYKITRDLTLNLGTRWDYFGVPWERSGLTTALQGGGYSLFGLSGRSFNNWMQPGVNGDLMHIIYVGPNSPNPGGSIYNHSLNNIGPAIGFAYNVPWGGKDKTTVRGGYQIQYTGGGRGFALDTAIGNPPGSSNQANYIIPANDGYMSLERIVANPAFVPIQPQFLPAADTVIPVTDRTATMNAFDPNFATPYIQNVTLSVTRTLSSKLTLDLRYIGTLSRKLPGNIDLNAVNFRSNGLKQAFDKARRGDDSPDILDKMFAGLNIAGPGFGPVGTTFNGVPQTAALHMRASSTFNANLANGKYVALATSLNTLTNPNATGPNKTNNPNLNGSVLRNSGQFPENFITANPQLKSAVMESSLGNAHYHSLQAQFNVRPVAGISTQTTYTWSRNLGNIPNAGIEGANGAGAAWTDPTNRKLDYMLQNSHREHVLVNYGTFDLPVGPSKKFLGSTHGVAGRLLENWQTSWVVNLSSGAPFSFTSQSMLYANGVPDVVGPFSTKNSYAWTNGAKQGNLWADSTGQPLYTFTSAQEKDPQCNNTSLVAPSIAGLCTLNAVKLVSTGQVVLQTPLPGTQGNLGQHNLTGLPTWKADMALQKRVKVAETKSITVRIDATNVFNHATPALPAGFLQPTVGAPSADTTQTFNVLQPGAYNNKCAVSAFCGGSYATGQRTFQLKARFDF